jgi:hypothetical protein
LGDRALTNPENFGLEESMTALIGNAGSWIVGIDSGGSDGGGEELLRLVLADQLTTEPRTDLADE